ncbi:universal stress protein [Massilia sp. LXY-6]|uniref:universal stress protein n=1 Tax=Massilia sp. LXY-6 TaxID=3379823 RepID=UPI003EE3D0D0
MVKPILVISECPHPVGHAAARGAMLAAALQCRSMDFLSSMREATALCECMEDVKQARASALLRFGVHCSARFDFGAFPASLMKRAIDADPLLIATAWQAHEWWPILHNFNLLRDICRASMKPVLLVRQPAHKPYAHAVFPSDFSPDSLNTLKVALRLLPATRLTIVHAFHVPGEGQMRAAGVRDDVIGTCRRNAERTAQEAFARMAAELRPRAAKLSLVLLPKPTGMAVANYVNAVDADIIVLSDSQRWLVDDWSWQTRAREMLEKTSSDLLMVSSPNTRSPMVAGSRMLVNHEGGEG